MLCSRCSRTLLRPQSLGYPVSRAKIQSRPITRGLLSSRLFSQVSLRRPSNISPASASKDASSLPISANQSRPFSSTASLGGPRNTFSPSHFVRKRRHGFLSRVRSRTGRRTLVRRRLKKRSTLSH